MRVAGDPAAYALGFSPDGTLVAAAFRGDADDAGVAHDSHVRIFDVASGTERASVKIEADVIRSVLAVTRSGHVVVVTEDLVLVSWDGTSKKVTASKLEIPDANTRYPSLRILPSLGLVGVALKRDATALVDLVTGKIRGELPGSTAALSASADGKVLARTSGVTIELHDGATFEPYRADSGLATYVHAVAFEPDASAVWTGDRTSARRWSLPSAALTATIETGGTVKRIGRDARAALISIENRGHVIELPTGKPIGTRVGVLHRVPSLSPDGNLVASIGEKAADVRLWSTATGKVARDLAQDALRHPYAIAFSPDGRLVASGRDDGIIHVWETVSGDVVSRFRSPGKPALSIAISPDEKLLAIGGDERTVRIVKLASGKLAHELEGHTQREVWALDFSPNGRLLASSDGKSVRLWDTKSGAPAGVASVSAHALAFSADSKLLAAGGDGEAWVIDVNALG